MVTGWGIRILKDVMGGEMVLISGLEITISVVVTIQEVELVLMKLTQ